jgi:hypothetical protein
MERDAWTKGWLVGQTAEDMNRIIDAYDPDTNEGLALAYKRYNYHANKYTKKAFIAHAIGMTFLNDANTAASIQ